MTDEGKRTCPVADCQIIKEFVPFHLVTLCVTNGIIRDREETFACPHPSQCHTPLVPRFFGRCPQNDSLIGFIVRIALIVFLSMMVKYYADAGKAPLVKELSRRCAA